MSERIKLTRSNIVTTAAEIADLEGLDNVTLAAVSARLGVCKPSLYNHINGLPELRAQLAIWGTNQLKEKISEAAIGKAKQDAIFAIATTYRAFAHQRPGLYRAILSSPDRDNLELKSAIQGMMAVIKTVMESYHLADSTHAVRCLRSLMHGFVSLEAAGWFAAPADKELSYRYLIATFVRGIDSPPQLK
ncbi:MAG TPA: TetR-like C-terminal domain-containing protein [Negativicutes bacterium]|nr:TetR-like C-terminal domain-containing protein [Negativicutes bacterium]